MRASGPVPARFGPARGGTRRARRSLQRPSFPLKGVDAKAFAAEERAAASFLTGATAWMAVAPASVLEKRGRMPAKRADWRSVENARRAKKQKSL